MHAPAFVLTSRSRARNSLKLTTKTVDVNQKRLTSNMILSDVRNDRKME